MPCVFIPYSVGTIHDMYKTGRSLNDVLEEPFFNAIREWQREYSDARSAPRGNPNLLSACPFRDHHSTFRKLVDRYRPESEDEEAGTALMEEEYCRRLCDYGADLGEVFGEIWQGEFNGGK